MKHHRESSHPPRSRHGQVSTSLRQRAATLCLLSLVTAIGITTSGCVAIAERVSDHLVKKDLKAVDQQFKVFGADLGMFRKCLKERGGSCQGSDATPLPHSSQESAAQAVTPVASKPCRTLADSVDQLPAGAPAKSALQVLEHPVVAQATALHNHLRGHDAGTVSGFSVEKGQGAHGGPESTATLDLGVDQVQHFHTRLLSSLGTTAWESLRGHCASLLVTHAGAPDRQQLEADCRRVAFIRGYLEAYTRKSEFVEVDVQLAGAIQTVNQAASAIKTDVNDLLGQLQTIETDVAQVEAGVLRDVSNAASKVGGKVEALVKKVGKEITRHFSSWEAGTLVSDLTRLAGEAGNRSTALAQAAGAAIGQDVKTLVSDLDSVLEKIGTELGKLEDLVSTLDQKVVEDINRELGKADATLSDVFQVSSVGFVSRDHTFRAKLPALTITLDPTAARLATFTDADTGQILTRASDFSDLGVATDTSGVRTGSSTGEEVVRVFLEAIFDAHEGLPAIAPANQPNARPTGLILGDYSLPLFSTNLGNVSSRDLSLMTHTNDQITTRTRAITGRAIAGIGPFSLNNPALEAFIVEIIATTVRQATAKATWCWYACNLDVDLKKLEADAKTAAEDTAKAVEDQAKASLHREAEHVKLRLKLSS